MRLTPVFDGGRLRLYRIGSRHATEERTGGGATI
jgi:hypothetical protein